MFKDALGHLLKPYPSNLAPNSRGQTLIEVLVALVLLGVLMGLIGIASFTAVRRSHQARTRTEASFIAQEGIETIKNFKDRNWGLNEAGVCIASTCAQPIIFAGAPVDVPFYSVTEPGGSLSAGEYFCFVHNSNVWYLSAPNATEEAADSNCRTNGNLGGAGDNFIWFARISVHDAGHPVSPAPPNCPNETLSGCFTRRVEVVVKWCPNDTLNAGACGTNWDTVRVLGYFYKWKEI